MCWQKLSCVVVVIVVLAAVMMRPAGAKEELPPGLLAASVGEQVILAAPLTGKQVEYPSGPVGWLYPAPGGVLFAPDLVNGVTTVIDLKIGLVLDRLTGVTMPIFGGSADRYVVAAGDVLLLSYPERAYIARIEAKVENPWQMLVTDDDGLLLVLERRPDGKGPCSLAAIDLHSRQIAYRRPLSGDVVHFDLSYSLRLLALAERYGHQVYIADPSSLRPVKTFALEGPPQDVAFAGTGEILAIALSRPDQGKGELLIIELKTKDSELKEKRRHLTLLPSPPVRIAVGPWQRRLAVALASGQVVIVEVDKGILLNTVTLPEGIRDLVWCDPQASGPLLPEWSDRRKQEPQLSIGFTPG